MRGSADDPSAAAVLLVSALWAARAEATYSIVAVDTRTREVGGAGASCVAGSTIYQIYGSVPGRGVVHAQARFGGPFRLVEAERLLAINKTPVTILRRLTDAAFDPSFAQRQYGVVDVLGRAAAFTGQTSPSPWLALIALALLLRRRSH